MRSSRLSTFALALAASLAACGLEVVGGMSDEAGPGGGPRSSDHGQNGINDDAIDASADDAEESSNANDAAPEAEATPSPGTALRFSSNSYVDIGELDIPTSFTLEAWVRPNKLGNERHVVAKDRNEEEKGQFRLGHDSNGRLFFMMSDANGEDRGLHDDDDDDDGYALLAPNPLPLATWSHVAVTKSGSNFALYIDGVAVRTFTTSAALTYGGPSIPFRIGARVAASGSGAQGGFDGDIDEVRLWSVARTPGEIAAARSAPLLPSAPGYASLVAYYRFDEGTGTTTAPTVGTLAGSLKSAPTWVPATWP